MENTYFSICIPTYNRANTIIRAIDSVYNQKFDSFEIILVDDGSTDNTKEIVNEYLKSKDSNKLKYIKKENGGLYTALETGYRNANGLFFVFLGSDDWLANNALNKLYDLCRKIENKKEYCGVICQSIYKDSNKLIGDLFFKNSFSYIDYHYIFPYIGKKYIDCIEANKTDIVKKYSFPRNNNIKYIPEAYVTDQIGLEYKLYASNEIIRVVEYMDDGISKDNNFKKKNAPGFLYYYILRIKKILPNAKLTYIQRFKCYIVAWYQYWYCVENDKENMGPRIKEIPFFGYLIKYFVKPLNYLYNRINKKACNKNT